MVTSALGKYRIIDLSTDIAGPFATKLFADYGADVVKVEPAGAGDPSRRVGPFHNDDPHPEKSLLFFYLNCNKRSVTLDISTTRGRKVLLELIKDADVLIENYAPGHMAEMGLGYEDLERINPRLGCNVHNPLWADRAVQRLHGKRPGLSSGGGDDVHQRRLRPRTTETRSSPELLFWWNKRRLCYYGRTVGEERPPGRASTWTSP